MGSCGWKHKTPNSNVEHQKIGNHTHETDISFMILAHF